MAFKLAKFTKQEYTDQWLIINYGGKKAGEVRVETTWQPDPPAPVEEAKPVEAAAAEEVKAEEAPAVEEGSPKEQEQAAEEAQAPSQEQTVESEN